MSGKLLACLLVFMIGCGDSDARIRSLSLDMRPDVYLAHHDLGFEEQAFDKKWLEEEIACHFDAENRCRNLAALLRMYVDAVPNSKKLKAYAYEIKNQLSHSDLNLAEIAMFLFLYCDDSNLIHLLHEHVMERVQQHSAPKVLSVSEIKKRLNSDDEVVVAQTMKTLLAHPANVQMSELVFEQVVIVSTHESLDRKTRYLASSYLSKMGFYVSYGESEQGKFTLGKISVHSGRKHLTEYLNATPISKVWKYHANNLSFNGSINRYENNSEMISFIQQLSFVRDPEARAKLEYILTTKSYKKSSPSLKFIVGDKLMYRYEEIGLPIIKRAYKEGNNAIKSTIVAKFNEHFSVDKSYWTKLMGKSSAAEQVMIKISKKQWDINIERNKAE